MSIGGCLVIKPSIDTFFHGKSSKPKSMLQVLTSPDRLSRPNMGQRSEYLSPGPMSGSLSESGDT